MSPVPSVMSCNEDQGRTDSYPAAAPTEPPLSSASKEHVLKVDV